MFSRGLAPLLLLTLAPLTAAHGAHRALIIQGDDPAFDGATEQSKEALEDRGYGVTLLHHTPSSPITSPMAAQALQEFALGSAAGDKKLLVLHCHGSPVDTSAGSDVANHRCCLDHGCTVSLSMPDIEEATLNAQPGTLTVLDRSCYSGATVSALARSPVATARGTCVVSASSSFNYAYIGLPEFAPYLGAHEIAAPRDMAMYAQIQSVGLRPDLIDQRVFASGCAGTMSLRRELSFLGGGEARHGEALRSKLDALAQRWDQAEIRGKLEHALSKVMTAYQRSSVLPSRPWPDASQFITAIRDCTAKLSAGMGTAADVRDLNILLSTAEDALCGATDGPCSAARL
jgi:hypothetical protein